MRALEFQCPLKFRCQTREHISPEGTSVLFIQKTLFRQKNRKAAARARLRLQTQIAVLFFDDFPGKIEPDTHALFIRNCLRTVKSPEDLCLLFRKFDTSVLKKSL